MTARILNNARTGFLQCYDPLDSLVGDLALAIEYLKSGPSLREFVDSKTHDRLEGDVAGFDHIGLHTGSPELEVQTAAKHLNLTVEKCFQSCQSFVKMFRLKSEWGRLEVTSDPVHYCSPHIAWRVISAQALMRVGHSLRDSGFRAPDELQNRIWFNRDEETMFRYFAGQSDGCAVRLEFCW